ncbi:MAG: hypothetical protein ACI4WX_16775 [Aristaeellaceae bacterium]
MKGEASATRIAAEMGMTGTGDKQIVEWAAIYSEKGIEGFHVGEGNERHTSEKKKQAVEEYFQGRGSLREICRTYQARFGYQSPAEVCAAALASTDPVQYPIPDNPPWQGRIKTRWAGVRAILIFRCSALCFHPCARSRPQADSRSCNFRKMAV